MGSKGKPTGRKVRAKSDAAKPGRRALRARQAEQRAAVRQALKERALECFAEWGFADTTIDDITGAAEIAHSAFYNHFDSKETLYAELMADGERNIIERIAPFFADLEGKPAAELLSAGAAAFIDYFDEHRTFVRALTRGPNPERAFIALLPNVLQALEAQIRRYGELHHVDLHNAEILASGLGALWMRVGIRYCETTKPRESPAARREHAETLARMTLGVFNEFAGVR